MDPELEEYLRQVESGQMSPELFKSITGVSYELAQGHFAGKNTPTDGTEYSSNWRDKMYSMRGRRWSQDEPNDMGIDYTQSADYIPNWRDKMYGTRRGMREGFNNQGQAPTEDRESYIERRQMESSTGGGGLTSSYEDLAKEYDDMQKGSSSKTGRDRGSYLDYLSYTPMDLESNIWATTHAAGEGNKKRAFAGAGAVGLGLARIGFSGLASGKASKDNYMDSREEAARKMKRFTTDQGGDLDRTGAWYGQYGGEKMSPAQRYQDIEAMYNYQEGGEMPPMEQPQEQMPPQEGQQQQGIPEEEMMVIAQQLMQEFQTMEEMQEYLMQQELPPAVVEQILQAVSILAQEGGGAQEPAQPEQMPKSQVMRDTMSGDMSVEMGFRYGGRYPKLR